MIRFGRGTKIAERFYVRQDGTRAYFFFIDELCNIFENSGFVAVRTEYLHKKTVNLKEEINVDRIFIQARFILRA
uniref:Methyltransferase n=1 Tax=Ditylenchus dipsaci TaxID=166011 RepID=A0A915ESA5_9BILA